MAAMTLTPLLASDPGPLAYLLFVPYFPGAMLVFWGLSRLICRKPWGWHILLVGLTTTAMAEYFLDIFLLRSRLFGN